MKILVVEDEPLSREVIQEILAEDGHEVKTSWRAKDAIAISKNFHPDVVISDWRLNDVLDGIDVCKEVLNESPESKVILMSAYPELEETAAAKGLPVCGMLHKPIELNELVSHVNAAAA